MMSVGCVSKFDMITIGTPIIPSGLVLNLNNGYLVPALSIKHCIWILFIARRLFI
jgi:hypothetical protein